MYCVIKGWKNLERIRHAGLVDFIGVSNFDINELKQLMAVTDSKVSVIQVFS